MGAIRNEWQEKQFVGTWAGKEEMYRWRFWKLG